MGSLKGRGNQYIQLVKVLYCKFPTDGKVLPAFPLEVERELNPGLRGGRREGYYWAPTHGREQEQLELFVAPTRGGEEMWQTSRDVLPHLKWVLRQLYPIIQPNHIFIELNLYGRECYVHN